MVTRRGCHRSLPFEKVSENMYNVVYLNVHDVGIQLPLYGYAGETPGLLAFAGDCLCFRNMHCASPTCSPSRGALLTGQFPHENGLVGLAHRGFEPNTEHHLAQYLKRRGYETVLAGVQHEILAGREAELGYMRRLDPEHDLYKGVTTAEQLYWQDERAVTQAIDYLLCREETERPFFMALGLGSTHRPYPEPDIEVNRVRPPAGIVDLPQTRRDMAGYLTALRRMDELCRKFLESLRKSGLYSSTIVIFTTDHGLPFPGMKCTLKDSGSRVAFLLKCPDDMGENFRGKDVEALVSQLDVFPTLCELLGLPEPKWLRGKSLMTKLERSCPEGEDAVFAELNYHIAYAPARSVRTSRYKYIRTWPETKRQSIPLHVDDSESKRALFDAGYFDERASEEQLFDVLLDPDEKKNLVHEPEMNAVLSDMRERMNKWQKETGDPLLRGRVPLPEGAICAAPEGYSTDEQLILPECRKNLEKLKTVLQHTVR